MAQVQLRFYEELNDFLPPERRKITFTHELTRRTSVKDLIESFGVPHTEVEVILANDRSVDFSYIVQAGDRISVYPVFESLDISPLIRLLQRFGGAADPLWRASGTDVVRSRAHSQSTQISS